MCTTVAVRGERRKNKDTTPKNEDIGDVPPLSYEDKRSAALALIGAKLDSEDPPCGLEEIIGALALRETEEDLTYTVPEIPTRMVPKKDKIVRPTAQGQYDWCATCGTKSLHLHTMKCDNCGNRYRNR